MSMSCPEPGCDYVDPGSLQPNGNVRSYNNMYWHMDNHAKVKGAMKEGRSEAFTNAKEASA